MQIIKNKEKIGNYLFFIGILLELIVMVTDHVSFMELPFRGRFTHVAFVLLGIKILSATEKASAPLMRITATPPLPGGVAIAAMVE